MMEMATLEMDCTEARQKFLEYKRAVQSRQDAEMKQIMNGYKALANGHQVIDIVATIRKGGTQKQKERWMGRTVDVPNLAIMRADQPWCWVETRSDGAIRFTNENNVAHNARRNVVWLPKGTIETTTRTSGFRAMVPPVPPALLPPHGLGNYHILWEAEWEHVAPRDPALLKHIGGDLYAVLAVWDLTEIERTVLGGRFR